MLDRKFKVIKSPYKTVEIGDVGELRKTIYLQGRPDIVYAYLLDFGKKGMWHLVVAEVEEIFNK